MKLSPMVISRYWQMIVFVLLVLPGTGRGEILFDLENSPYTFIGGGDQNGDGFNDLIVFDDTANRIILFFGGTTMDTVPDVIMTDVFPDSITDLTEGYILSTLGDVNGDGIHDFRIMVYQNSPERLWSFIFYGGTPPEFSGLVLTGWTFEIGDVNADGYSDILNINSFNYTDGVAMIYFGGDSLDLTPDWVVHFDPTEWWRVGENFWKQNPYNELRDLNDDGIDDLILGLKGTDQVTSRSLVYWGGSTFDTIPDIETSDNQNWHANYITPVGDLWGTGYSAVSMWTIMDSTIQLWSSVQNLVSLPDAKVLPAWGNRLGQYHVKYVGDINGDGYDDLLTTDPSGGFGGQIVLYIAGPDFDELPDVVIDGMGLGWLYSVGAYFSWVGDMNGDGCDDICFSASNSGGSSLRLIIVAGDSTWHTNHIPRIVDWSPRDSLVYAAPGDTLNFFLDVQDRDTNQQLFYTWQAGQVHASPFDPEYSHNNPFNTVISDTIIHASAYVRVDVWDGYLERSHFWQVIIDTAYTDINWDTKLPISFRVGKPYPNPFNDSTVLKYSLPEPARVEATVYDLTGRVVRQWVHENQIPGEHHLVWTGMNEQDRPVGSGIYLIRIRMGENKYFIRKISLIK